MARRQKIVLTRKFDSYKDKHKDEKFLICGLGPSIINFNFDNYKDYIKIGVNDIEKYLLPDYIVIADNLKRFKEERQSTIINGKCNNVFTHIEHLADGFTYLDHNRLILTTIKSIGSSKKLSDSHLLFSNNSTFIACDLARFMGASEIKIIGMDFKDHKHLNTTSAFSKIKNDFMHLEKLFKQKNIKIENLSKDSIVNFTN